MEDSPKRRRIEVVDLTGDSDSDDANNNAKISVIVFPMTKEQQEKTYVRPYVPDDSFPKEAPRIAFVDPKNVHNDIGAIVGGPAKICWRSPYYFSTVHTTKEVDPPYFRLWMRDVKEGTLHPNPHFVEANNEVEDGIFEDYSGTMVMTIHNKRDDDDDSDGAADDYECAELSHIKPMFNMFEKYFRTLCDTW